MKVAVITGAAKGLGADVCRALVKESYTLVVHYNKSKDAAEELVNELKVDNTDCFAISADMTNESSVFDMFKEVEQKLGRIDLLVNNVGNFVFKPFYKTTNAEFRDMIESNLYSTLYASRAVLPVMRKQKCGNIINVGAVGCERIILRENSMPYFLGKTGVYVLTKAMAYEEARNGIRVNMVSPASMKEDIFKAGDFPSGRPATSADVMRAIMFLISGENNYINGANIEVAGGFVPGI